MGILPDSMLSWVLGAVAVFWFVGAHNRLVRLRSAALQAYAGLDGALVRQLDYVQARLASPAPVPAGSAADDAASVGTALQAAAGQMVTLLGTARPRPLEPGNMAALSTALRVLVMAWERLYPGTLVSFEPDGTLGALSRPAPLGGVDALPAPPVPASPPMAWPEPSAAAEIARTQFNLAVAKYNSAIREFPAGLVAWIFRLQPAAPLG